MLTESTVIYVSTMASQLKEAGVGIRALAYTPLANVVSAANPVWTDVLETKLKTSTQDNTINVLMNATRNGEDMSEHTAVVSSLSEQLAANVVRHISVARSIVRPAVDAYADAVVTRMQSFKHNDPTHGFTINEIYIPEPLLNPALLDDLKIHKNRDIPTLSEFITIGQATDEDLVNNLFTGHGSTDEDIRTWIGHVGVGLLRKVWDDHFTGTKGMVNLQYVYDYKDRLNAALALYLYSRKLTLNPASVPGVTPLAYANKLSAAEYFAGSYICSQLSELDIAAKSNRLVMQASPIGKTVTVYGPVYNKYLEEGGSIDVLFGMLAGGITAVSIDGVRGVTDKAITAWNRHISLSNYMNKKNRAEMLRSIYSSEFVTQLSNMDSFEKEYRDANPGSADVAYKRAKDYIECLDEKELEDINAIALKLIAEYRFAYTQSYQILSDIEEAMAANKNLDPREAALIATINLVTDYVSAQMQRI